MKHPTIHPPIQSPSGQPVLPPRDERDDESTPRDGAADDGHDVRYESTVRDRPGLVGVDFDLAPAQERRRH